MASIEARVRQPLSVLVKKLGKGENASWDTTMAFLTDERVNSRPVFPARTKEENLANPYPFWPPKPKGETQTEKEWGRRHEMLGQYASGTDRIDIKYGVTRQFVHEQKDKALVNLHQASSLDVQEEYPLESLATRRPVPDETRKRNSDIQFQREGISKKIGDLFVAGVSVKEIQAQQGEDRVLNARRVLRERGEITVPYIKEGTRTPQAFQERRRALASIRSGEWDTKKTQEYLDGLNGFKVRKLFRSHVLTSLAKILWSAGIQTYKKENQLEDAISLLKQMDTVVAVSKPYYDKKKGRNLIYYGVLSQKIDEVKKLLEGEVFDALRKPNNSLAPVSRSFENRFNGVEAS